MAVTECDGTTSARTLPRCSALLCILICSALFFPYKHNQMALLRFGSLYPLHTNGLRLTTDGAFALCGGDSQTAISSLYFCL